MTCPKCKRAIPESLSCCPYCGAAFEPANDPSRRQEKTGNGGGWLSALFGFGVLAAMAALCFLFGNVKIGHKSVLFWIAVAGFLISRDHTKGKIVKSLMLAGVVAILCMFTNPSYDAHYEKMAENSGLVKIFTTELFTGFSRQNWVLFSVGKCGGENVTVGLLGKVFWVGGE